MSTISESPYSSSNMQGPYNKSYISQPNSSYYSQSTHKEQPPGLCGLVNQAMTCYLNSLLQTLYMTPEFRNALYRWRFEGESAKRCIPYHLQRLYLQMQTGKRRAVETTDITRSFGWDSSDAWQQHDVQELCRVMFDALEETWKNTEQEHLINELYQGKLKDYVKCLECKNESARVDAYLDIPLVIKPFGAQFSFKSVEAALRAFIEPEILSGNNQYQCEQCNKKCDAHKGLKFMSFPYLLTLQLKRFDFDYTTMQRIKLNDRMTFPAYLDLNPFVDDQKMPVTPGANGDVGDSPFAGYDDDDDDDAFEPAEENLFDLTPEGAVELIKGRGEYVYELFSIMIHSGSAMGGHYYAYIKSFADNDWYSFNDQSVERITKEDIKKTYGGAGTSRPFLSSTYASSMNAYMLMYRKIDPDKNADLMVKEDFPQHIRELVTAMQSESEASKKQKELEKCMCKVKTYCHHPTEGKLVQKILEVHKDCTLMETTQQAHQLFELDGLVPKDCVRLVKYDDYNSSIDRSYHAEHDRIQLIGNILGGVKSLYGFELLLEIKAEDDEWQHYNPGGYSLKTYKVDLANGRVDHEHVNVRVDVNTTVNDFRTILRRLLKLPSENMRCVLEKYGGDKVYMSPDTEKLQSFDSCLRGDKIYVDLELSSDCDCEFEQSRLYEVIDTHQNTVKLIVTIPSATEIAKFKEREAKRKPEPMSDGDPLYDTDHTDLHGHSEYVNSPPSLARLNPVSGDSELDEVDKTEGVIKVTENISQDQSSNIDTSSNSQPPIRDTVSELNQQNLAHHTLAMDTTASASTLNEDNKDTPLIPPAPPLPPTDVPADGIEEEEMEEDYSVFEPAILHCEENTAESNNKLTVLNMWLDKRMYVTSFKEKLQPKLGVSLNCFKLYRVYSNNQEFEPNQNDTLANMVDDSKMTVKLGRVPMKGEYKMKLFELVLNAPPSEASKPLFDIIVAKGWTISQVQELVSYEMQAEYDRIIIPDRIRFRKKSWKNPGTIYTAGQKIAEDIMMYNYSEMFMQVLDEPDTHRGRDDDLCLFVQQWKPSLHEFGKMSEIILPRQSDITDLKKKLSEVCEISVECVEVAKGKGAFPGDISVLDVQSELEWNAPATTLSSWPLCIIDDGTIIIYRDKSEEIGELSSEKKKEIHLREAASSTNKSTHWSYPTRKEKALKIHRDSPSSKPDSSDLD